MTAIEKDVPDSVDLTLVKPRVIDALVLAFCSGAFLLAKVGVDTLERMRDERPPRN